MANKVLKNIPKSENICVNLRNEAGILTHVITEKVTAVSKEYTMYKVEKDKTYSLLGKGNNPNKLEEKFVYKEKNKKK